MNTALLRWRLLILCLMVLLIAVPSKADAGRILGSFFVISADPEEEVTPAIAYNSTRQQYLVVWSNDRAGCDDIRAQRISKDGKLLGGPFYISAGCPADRRYPDVAYNAYFDTYLVVWEQYHDSKGYSIQSRGVSGTGAVFDGGDIEIRSSGYNLYTPVKPAVVSSTYQYLVVWAETWHPLPLSFDIYGQLMGFPTVFNGSRFSISHGTDSREEPDLVYNPLTDRYLVVWQQQDDVIYALHGQQVSSLGTLYRGDITIIHSARSATSPAVAAIPNSSTDIKYLVVFEHHLTPGYRDIAGKMLYEDGTVGNYVSFTYEDLVPIDQSSPAVVGSESDNRYFVVWREPRGTVDKPIKCQSLFIISNDGWYFYDEDEFTGVNADRPALVQGYSGDFLVAWHDQPPFATNSNIYGQLWGNRLYIPLLLRK